MANVSFPIGRDAQLYFNSGGTLIVPTGTNGITVEADITTWFADPNTEASLKMRNLALSLETNRVDTNTRETMVNGYMSEKPVSKQAEITFDTGWDLSVPFVRDLLTAWDTSVRMAFAVLNRDKDDVITGDWVNGWVGNCWVSFTKDENADDVQRGNFTITHADAGFWYQVLTP